MIIYSDNHLGDLVCMERSIRHIKQVRPAESIEVYCKFPEVFKNNPAVARAERHTRCSNYDLAIQVSRDIHISKWLCAAAGIPADFEDTAPRIYLDDEDVKSIDKFRLPEEKPIMAFSYMTGATFKLWNHHRWIEVIRQIKEAGYFTVMLGQKQNGSGCDLDLTGKTSIRQAAAVLSRCKLFVGIDAGLSHVAAAVGTKSVILYGPFDYRMIYHKGLITPVYTDVCTRCRDKIHTSVCLRQGKNSRACMMSISVDRVMAAIEGRPAAARRTLQNSLKAMDYGEAYYLEHKAAGLDYLNYGDWQRRYADMVCQSVRPGASMLDVGCACGSILNGFSETRRFSQLKGIDLCETMVLQGREKFGLDLMVCDAVKTAFQDNQFDFIHSANVFEHLSPEAIEAVLKEIKRILKPGGKAFICLDALAEGENKNDYLFDPTHINIQPISYWDRLFYQHGFIPDTESMQRFYTTQTFWQGYPQWRVFCLSNLK